MTEMDDIMEIGKSFLRVVIIFGILLITSIVGIILLTIILYLMGVNAWT